MNELEFCLLALTVLVVCCVMLIGMLIHGQSVLTRKINEQNQRDVDPLGRTERFS